MAVPENKMYTKKEFIMHYFDKILIFLQCYMFKRSLFNHFNLVLKQFDCLSGFSDGQTDVRQWETHRD